MSELHDILSDVVQDRLSGTSDVITNLTTGKTFNAEVEGNLDMTMLPEEFMLDKRAKVRLHVASDSEAASVGLNDIVRFKLYGKSSTFYIVDRQNDPASLQTKFLAVEKVSEKDA